MLRPTLLAGLAFSFIATIVHAQPPGGRGPWCGVHAPSHGNVTVIATGTQFSIPQLTREGRFAGQSGVFGCWVWAGTSDDVRGVYVLGYRITDPSGASKEFGPYGIEAGGYVSTDVIPVPRYKPAAGNWSVTFFTARRDNGARTPVGTVSFVMIDGPATVTPPPGTTPDAPRVPPIVVGGTRMKDRDTVVTPPPEPPRTRPAAQATSSPGVLFMDAFDRPDAASVGQGWTEYTMADHVPRAEDSPWRIRGNTLRYESQGYGAYVEDFVETTATFPSDNIRVEFELRGQASTTSGYVGPTVYLSGDGRSRATAQNVTGGPKPIGVAAWYRWENRGTRGVMVVTNGETHDHPTAEFAGLNQPAFAKHTITIRGGTLTYEADGFAPVSYPVSASALGERRHLSFGVRLYDARVPQVVEIRNVRVTALGGGGTITTASGQASAATVLVRQSVPASGGRIEYHRAGDPLDGLAIDVPAGAYSGARQFTVSSRPAPFAAATPLIRVDNGGDYSTQPMSIRIPVQVRNDEFAMAFFFDEATGNREGLPLLGQEAGSVTSMTRHFSEIYIMKLLRAELPTKVTSGYVPGVDDWQMVNHGTVIAPGGHCAGQSVSSMWYYYEKKLRGAPPLYGLFDNNVPGFKSHPLSGKTPMRWQDDSLALRLVSTIQDDGDWESAAHHAWWGTVWGQEHDTWAFNAFRLSMSVTGEPQYVEIWHSTRDADNRLQDLAGHALVVYRIDGFKLYVADPNYPGSRDASGRIVDRVIEFDPATQRFRPFEASASSGSTPFLFNDIFYAAKSAIVSWPALNRRWDEFSRSFAVLPSENEKQIGHDRFPEYRLSLSTDGFKSGTDQRIVDNMTLDSGQIEVQVKCERYVYPVNKKDPRNCSNSPMGVLVYQDGREIMPVPGEKIMLKPGRNALRFFVRDTPTQRWVDFKEYYLWSGPAVTTPPPPPPTSKPKPCAGITVAGLRRGEQEGIGTIRMMGCLIGFVNPISTYTDAQLQAVIDGK